MKLTGTKQQMMASFSELVIAKRNAAMPPRPREGRAKSCRIGRRYKSSGFYEGMC